MEGVSFPQKFSFDFQNDSIMELGMNRIKFATHNYLVQVERSRSNFFPLSFYTGSFAHHLLWIFALTIKGFPQYSEEDEEVTSFR